MAAKEAEPEHEPLTEEQRITALEQKVGTNKLFLFAIALFLIVVISVSVTIIGLTAGGDEETVNPEDLISLQEEVASLKQLLEEQNSSLKKSASSLSLFEEQLANSSNKVIQDIILDQEKSHQVFLDTLRSGMYDLAHMVPGSRTWLDVYSDKIDKAAAHSKSREKDLSNLMSNQVSEDEEEPFFGGF